jgi:hypothetical protein
LIALPPVLLALVVVADVATVRIGLMLNRWKSVGWFFGEIAFLAILPCMSYARAN